MKFTVETSGIYYLLIIREMEFKFISLKELCETINKCRNFQLTWKINHSITVEDCKKLIISDAVIDKVVVKNSKTNVFIEKSIIHTLECCGNISLNKVVIRDIIGENIESVELTQSYIIGKTDTISKLILNGVLKVTNDQVKYKILEKKYKVANQL